MPFVYPSAEKLKDEPKVGDGDCVALVKAYTIGLRDLSTASWRPGEPVLRNHSVQRGTAIATFENGSYPNRPSGNHACLFVGQGGDAIYVIDQYRSSDPTENVIVRRRIRSKGKRSDGTFIDPSNNADAFSVIEL